MLDKVKKYLAAIAAILGIAAGYGLANTEVLDRAATAVKAAQAAVEVVEPTAPAEQPAP